MEGEGGELVVEISNACGESEFFSVRCSRLQEVRRDICGLSKLIYAEVVAI